MSETEAEDRETIGERESDTLLEDIVDKKVTPRQLCGHGSVMAKATRSRRSRSAKYAGG